MTGWNPDYNGPCYIKANSVIPAKAGTQGPNGSDGCPWTPAFTGATNIYSDNAFYFEVRILE
jgi:hypothetical protein